MIEWLIILLPYVLSAITGAQMYLAGNKITWVWKFGLYTQIFWLLYIYLIGAWGLLPGTFLVVVVYTRNHFKWKGEADD